MLLNKAHEEKFGEDVGNINYEGRLHELNLEIRKALETGTAYDRGLPDGAILWVVYEDYHFKTEREACRKFIEISEEYYHLSKYLSEFE